MFCSNDVVMWSQGSSGVLKSCSCSLFQIFLNFQVLFKWYSCYFPQVVWSCYCNLFQIFLNFQLLFKWCSCYFPHVQWSYDLRVHVVYSKSCSCNLFQFFLNFQVLFKWCSCSFLQVMWSCDLRGQVACSKDVHIFFSYFSAIYMLMQCSSNSHFNLVTVDIAHVAMWCEDSSDAQECLLV